MKGTVACLLLLSLAACDQETAPADQVKVTAEKIVNLDEPTPAPLAHGPYAPRDTCDTVEGAEDFRNRLAQVVEARDVEGLVALAASDVKLDFGGGAGADELRRRLESDEWNLWDELDQLMTLGCSANKQGGITIPWYFDQAITGVDSMNGMLVTGEDVPLLAAPDPNAQRLAMISWNVVKVQALAPDEEYQQVETLDGKTGFIATDKLRSLLDYRLIASKRNDKWSITSFIAGD